MDNTPKVKGIFPTIEEAKTWYNSGNDTLKALALKAFTEEHLVEHYFDINMMLKAENKAICLCDSNIIIPKDLKHKYDILFILENLATFYNKGWKRKIGEQAFHICRFYNTDGYGYIKIVNALHGHTPGCIYFKRKEDAEAAIIHLGNAIEFLF